MNPKDSLYRQQMQLIELQQLRNCQEQKIKNSETLERLRIVKECFETLNDIAETRIDFQINSDITDPYLNISREGAKNLIKLKSDIFDFYSEAERNTEIESANLEKNASDLEAFVRNTKERLDLCRCLENNCDFIVANVLKIQHVDLISK